MTKNILIRTDASSRIGSGHLMRMLALGQLLSKEKFDIHFATIAHDQSMLEYLKEEPFHIHLLAQDGPWDPSKDLETLLSLAARIRPSWICVDGYQFPTGYEDGIKKGGFRLLRVCDLPKSHCVADVLLDQSYGAEKRKYSTEPYTHLLAGLKHLLLRREFLAADLNNKRFFKSGPFHLLVTLGGGSEISDSLNLKIARGLSQIRDCKGTVSIVVGKMGRVSDELAGVVRRSELPIKIIKGSRNIADEMLKADLAIVSGGCTMWELMHMKVPFLSVSLTAAQQEYLKFLAEADLCASLGWHEDVTPDTVRRSVLDFIRDAEKRRRISDNCERSLDRNNTGREILEVLNGRS